MVLNGTNTIPYYTLHTIPVIHPYTSFLLQKPLRACSEHTKPKDFSFVGNNYRYINVLKCIVHITLYQYLGPEYNNYTFI